MTITKFNTRAAATQPQPFELTSATGSESVKYLKELLKKHKLQGVTKLYKKKSGGEEIVVEIQFATGKSSVDIVFESDSKGGFFAFVEHDSLTYHVLDEVEQLLRDTSGTSKGEEIGDVQFGYVVKDLQTLSRKIAELTAQVKGDFSKLDAFFKELNKTIRVETKKSKQTPRPSTRQLVRP